jgi:hypothetical protein
MTMIDETTLATALKETADTFDVSSEAAQRIVDQMRADEAAPGARVARIIRQPGRARNVFMGLAALVVALAVGGTACGARECETDVSRAGESAAEVRRRNCAVGAEN